MFANNQIFAAPLAGVTDKPFRTIIRRFAPDVRLVTEMISCHSLVGGHRNCLRNFDDYRTEGNIGAQIFGADASLMADAAKILRDAGFECIPFSNYTALLEVQGRTKALEQLATLNNNECILIKYQPDSDNDETGNVYPLLIGNEEIPVIVTSVTLDNPISFANSVGTLVISDNLYHTIAGQSVPAVKILSINGKSIEGNEALFQALSDYLSGSPYLQGNSHRVHDIFSLSSSTFLLIGFLVVLFFIATGSILYFNNVSAVTDSKSDYEILWKMGYTDKKIKKIIKKQAAAFFSIPFLFGLADCVFGTLVYKSALMQNILENSPLLYATGYK